MASRVCLGEAKTPTFEEQKNFIEKLTSKKAFANFGKITLATLTGFVLDGGPIGAAIGAAAAAAEIALDKSVEGPAREA